MKKIKVNDDWFIAELIEQCETVGRDKTNPNRRCTVWRNAILINASSLSEAYDKAVRFGKENYRQRYKAVSGDTVQWHVLGVADILPVDEDIGDGGELFWADHGDISAKRAQTMVRTKREILKERKKNGGSSNRRVEATR